MADFTYNITKGRILTADVDFETADIRILLLEVDDDGTEGTQKDRISVGAILGSLATEATHTGYSRLALASKAVTVDNVNDEAVFDSEDVVWSSIAAGPDIVAAIIYQHLDINDTNNIPIYKYESGFPQTPNGESFAVRWNSQGLTRVRDPL